MSIHELLSQEQFEHLRKRFLASVRVAENNDKNGVVFKNGQGPMDPGRRELITTLLDENYQFKKTKRD